MLKVHRVSDDGFGLSVQNEFTINENSPVYVKKCKVGFFPSQNIG